MKLHTHKFSLAGAIFAALSMLVLSFAKALNVYQGATDHMQEMHMFYSPGFGGTITGMIEAAIITYISLYVFIWIYNWLLESK